MKSVYSSARTGSLKKLQGGREKSPYTDQYANIILFESLTQALFTCPVNPYVHLDAGHTNECSSMSSVTYVGAFFGVIV
jgi:hypothetical protein